MIFKPFNPFSVSRGVIRSVLRITVAACLLVTVSGCASGPIKTDEKLADLSVGQVRQQLGDDKELNFSTVGAVMWGGVILDTKNLANATQLEVMGYPLDRRQRPMIGRNAEGRFLVTHTGFLEPVDYAAGRVVTVLGFLAGVSTGTVGEAEYQYPQLQASDIHLWNVQAPATRPGFTFGVGVNIGN